MNSVIVSIEALSMVSKLLSGLSFSHSHSHYLSLTLSWSSILSILQGYSSQHYIYNDRFPKCEIPEWFCHQSCSLLRIQLIPNLYTNSDWIGIALFATFTVHKHPTLILDNSATEISHGFSCSLRSDMGNWTVSNKHYITESEHNKFIWLKQRKIMHVPHAQFSDKLNCSNLLTALFGSDSEDLMV